MLKVWKIVKFKVVSVDAGAPFFSGDSYIVLNSKSVRSKTGVEFLSHDVHFWLGAETTQDEAGAAAYKAVELDNFLDRAAVQHREVMGHESELFLSYFVQWGGLRTMAGGAESGFNIVKPETYRPRLLQIKGLRVPHVTEVPVSASSLNEGDAFVLDMGLDLYQWTGAKSSMRERGRASQLVRAIDSERSGRPKVYVEQRGQESDAFWKALGGKADIAPPTSDESPDVSRTLRLFRLSDETGKMTFTKLQEGLQLDRNLIDSKDAFVVDAGNEIYVFVGSKASEAEKLEGPKYAMKYMAENNRPSYLPLTVVREGGANSVFETVFTVNTRSRALDPEDLPSNDPIPSATSTSSAAAGKPNVLQVIKEADKDGDGKVSLQEMVGGARRFFKF